MGNMCSFLPFLGIPQTKEVPLHELDPRNYKFVPSVWTQRIRPAGRPTYKSEALYSVIKGEI